MTTPTQHIDIETISCLETASPRKRNARIVAKRGDVLPRKETFDSEMSLTAVLNRKKVAVPVKALMITSFHVYGGMSVKLIFSLTAIT